MRVSEEPHICGCCGGSGEVEALDGTRRPCSRCRALDCDRWFDARRAGNGTDARGNGAETGGNGGTVA